MRTYLQSFSGLSEYLSHERTRQFISHSKCDCDRLPKQAHKAKQRICLTGLGTKTFTTAATAIQMLWQVLSEEAPRSALQAWTPRQAHGMLELEFSNRYFCLGRDMPATEQVAISDTVDPFSILRRLCPSNHSSSDNEVHYFERRTDQKSYVLVVLASDLADRQRTTGVRQGMRASSPTQFGWASSSKYRCRFKQSRTRRASIKCYRSCARSAYWTALWRR